MDAEEEMIEEHLDEEYQSSGICGDLAEYEKQIGELEKAQLKVNHDLDIWDKLEKAIKLLRLHVQNYQRIILFNRRRARQRLKRRQCTLRNFFLQSLMEMQIRHVEMLPLAIEPQILMGSKPNTDSAHNVSRESSSGNNVEVMCFYKDIVANFTNEQWLDTFHMPKHLFNLICSRLKSILKEEVDMHFESWIAMCIYTIATGSKFSSVGMLFNVEKKFVRQSLFKFNDCLLHEFSENRLSMPQNLEELEKISHGFRRASNMFPCVGVVSIFELPNQCSCGRYKRCGTKPIIAQVCIDDRLVFRKVEIANPKPSMFLKSPNEISFIWKKISDDCVVPYFVAAPPQLPLRNWLMQKYDKPHQTWEHNFNKCFDNLNIFREVSLKTLFGRWQILCSTECMVPEKKSLIIKVCCLLHNLLEESGENFYEEWSENINLYKYEHKITPNVTRSFDKSKSAIEYRNAIAKLIGSSTKAHKG